MQKFIYHKNITIGMNCLTRRIFNHHDHCLIRFKFFERLCSKHSMDCLAGNEEFRGRRKYFFWNQLREDNFSNFHLLSIWKKIELFILSMVLISLIFWSSDLSYDLFIVSPITRQSKLLKMSNLSMSYQSLWEYHPNPPSLLELRKFLMWGVFSSFCID
jgi:hypothetical protein